MNTLLKYQYVSISTVKLPFKRLGTLYSNHTVLVVARECMSDRNSILAIGILSVPTDHRSREFIRGTWLRDEAIVKRGSAVARFVIGARRRCAIHLCVAENDKHGDMAFVNSSDCQPWHASHKVSEWYRYAIRSFPFARWLAKAEDDSMVLVSAILADLALLRHVRVDYYGFGLQWIAHCRQDVSHAPRLANYKQWAAVTCAQGCWLGKMAGTLGSAATGSGRPSRCERGFDGRSIFAGSHPASSDVLGTVASASICSSLPYGVFAPGPLEVRSRHLATQLATRCPYADAYFASLVARGRAIRDECASTDGAQGHVLAECMRSARPRYGALIVADGGEARQAYPSRATAARLTRAAHNATGRSDVTAAAASELSVLHPIKPGPTSAAAWSSFWRMMRMTHQGIMQSEPASASSVVPVRPPIRLARLEWDVSIATAARNGRHRRPLASWVGQVHRAE